MVGPTKRKPSAFSALEMALETGVSAGTVLKLRVPVDLRAPVEEAPQERRQGCVRCCELQQRARVVDGGLDLEPVAHDAGIGHQAGDVLGAVAGDALGVEAVEGAAEILALLQDRQPRQAGLEAFQHQLLEQRAVVGLAARPTPRRGSAHRSDRRCRPRGSARSSDRWLSPHGASAAAAGARSKVAQSGLRSVIATPPAVSACALGLGLRRAIEPQRAPAPAVPATEPTVPIAAAPALISAPGGERRLALDRHHALAHAGAVLHAAHHLLADEAALGEGDAVELVEVGLVREGIAEGVVLAALGHAERDAMRVVVLRRRLLAVRRAERCQPRTSPRPGCASRARRSRGSAKDDGAGRLAGAVRSIAPQREHAVVVAGIRDRRPWRAACTG